MPVLRNVNRPNVRCRALRCARLRGDEINAQLDYLEEQAGLETAEHFLDQLITSFETLAHMPRMGVPCGFRKLAIRRWPVKGFENWLIFYRPMRDGVEIAHIMHETRDIESLLGGETGN